MLRGHVAVAIKKVLNTGEATQMINVHILHDTWNELHSWGNIGFDIKSGHLIFLDMVRFGIDLANKLSGRSWPIQLAKRRQ